MIITSSVNPAVQQAEERRVRLERLLQVATRDFEFRLEFGNRDLLGDGEIVMHASAEEVATTGYRALKGQALHLLGHYLGDTLAWVDTARREEAAGQPHFMALWHALEDARVENWLVQRWPGMHKAFEANLPANLGGLLLPLMAATHQIEMGLYLEGRGYREAQYSSPVRAALDAAGEPIREGASGETPRASLEAMRMIYPAVAVLLGSSTPLYDMPRERESERRQTDPQSAKADGESPESEEVPRDGSPEIETSDDLVAVGGMGRRREFPEWFRPGTAPWFERGLGEKDVYPAAVRTDRQTIVRPPRGDHRAYRALWSEVQREVGYLTHRLTNLIREEIDVRHGGYYRSGKLNMAKLWKQRMGYFRLFQRPVRSGRRAVAFTLLVDESASMKGQAEAVGGADVNPSTTEAKYRIAKKAAVLLGETLDQLDVPLEIIGFTTSDFEARAAMQLGLTPAHEYRTMRCSPLEHRIYKRFDEPYRLARTRTTDIQPRHNNWDEEHLLFAFRRIQARNEPAKVIIVISDGQPNGDADQLITTVSALEDLGCKIVGIGIGADFVREIYTHAIVVSSFQQMAEELLDILTRELRSSPSSITSSIVQ